MDAPRLANPQRRSRNDDPGIEVATNSEKELNRTQDPIYVSGPYRPGGAEEDEPRAQKTICGVKPIVFWTLLAIVLLVIIGAAVGGGVGGALANRHNTESSEKSSSSATSSDSSTTSTSSTSAEPTTSHTATTTSSAAVTSGTTGVAANPCPSSNLTTVTGDDGSIFTLLCAVDWPGGDKASSGNGTVEDLTRTTRYTLKSCISDCVDWNEDSSNDGKCKGVIYEANLTDAYGGGQDGNCFLKNAVGVYYPNTETSMAAGILGG